MNIQQIPPGQTSATTIHVGSTVYPAQTIGSKSSDVLVLDTGSNASVTIGRFSNNVNPIDFQGLKSRATAVGSHAAVQTGDNILNLSAHADDGTDYNAEVGRLLFKATGTISTGIVPGQFLLQLANGSGAITTVLSAVAGTITLPDELNIALGTTTGTKIGTATNQKLGFYDATPVVKQATFTQTYSTASTTVANPTASTLTDNSGGTATTTVEALPNPADTPLTADVLRDDLVANLIPALRNNIADLTAQVNALIADGANTKQVLNQLIDSMQAYGLNG